MSDQRIFLKYIPDPQDPSSHMLPVKFVLYGDAESTMGFGANRLNVFRGLFRNLPTASVRWKLSDGGSIITRKQFNHVTGLNEEWVEIHAPPVAIEKPGYEWVEEIKYTEVPRVVPVVAIDLYAEQDTALGLGKPTRGFYVSKDLHFDEDCMRYRYTPAEQKTKMDFRTRNTIHIEEAKCISVSRVDGDLAFEYDEDITVNEPPAYTPPQEDTSTLRDIFGIPSYAQPSMWSYSTYIWGSASEWWLAAIRDVPSAPYTATWVCHFYHSTGGPASYTGSKSHTVTWDPPPEYIQVFTTVYTISHNFTGEEIKTATKVESQGVTSGQSLSLPDGTTVYNASDLGYEDHSHFIVTFLVDNLGSDGKATSRELYINYDGNEIAIETLDGDCTGVGYTMHIYDYDGTPIFVYCLGWGLIYGDPSHEEVWTYQYGSIYKDEHLSYRYRKMCSVPHFQHDINGIESDKALHGKGYCRVGKLTDEALAKALTKHTTQRKLITPGG